MDVGSINSLMSVGATAGTLVVGAGSAWFARQAAKRSEPTSNGFVKGLNERLDKQDAILARLDARLDTHMRDHAFSRPLPTDKD